MIYDVIVVGAGQAGLAMGYYLSQSNVTFTLLDQSKEVGTVWKERYDSLTLFTPSAYSSLPGWELKGGQCYYPTKDEVSAYLQEYAKKFSLPVQCNTEVYSLSLENGTFKLTTNQGDYQARNVVIATGPFQQPNLPEYSTLLNKDIVQLHSSEYRNSKQLTEGPVLVVGGGNSGAQIAVELSKERKVTISVAHQMKFLPQDIGGKSIFWYFDKLGVYKASPESWIGQKIKGKPDPIFGMELKNQIKTGRIVVKPRAVNVNEDSVIFQDGTRMSVENVIWSTGFKSDYQWIHIKRVLNESGRPLHNIGITSIKGLYFLGLPWQSNRSSALLQGVGNDAKYLYTHMIEQDN